MAPVERFDVVKLAVPFDRLAVPSSVPPSKNETVPVGAVVPDAGLTVATRVTDPPAAMEVAEGVSVVEVFTAFADEMETDTAEEVEGSNSEFPTNCAVTESVPTGRAEVLKIPPP